jgi:hypothetical protein
MYSFSSICICALFSDTTLIDTTLIRHYMYRQRIGPFLSVFSPFTDTNGIAIA